MEEIDIRDWYEKKKKEVNRKTITEVIKIHSDGRWFALKSVSINAYGFRRILRGSKKLGSRWYTGSTLTFTKAIASCNKLYGMKVPRDGWTTLKMKCYNHQDWCNYETIIKIKYIHGI